ncbi:MAG: hypothetical protein MR350_01295 [Alphaproteobacteria bacterium]|nr:hypothetical protein [Alphaproteobacteria bacterium]
MKQILKNGLTIVSKNSNKFEEVSLTFKCGHVNEPKVGIAAVYEKIVTNNSSALGSIYGGSMTSFVVSSKPGDELISIDDAVKVLYDGCVKVPVKKHALIAAVNDIIQHTEDMAPLPERQVKLAYKHTAFGNSTLWKTDEYIDKISELKVKDVKDYISGNFVGNNLVLGYCGPELYFDKFVAAVKKHFGSLSSGAKNVDCSLEYTGGFQVIEGGGIKQVARFGWNLPKEYNTAETNILMSMLAGRLERSVAEANIAAETVVKIAGYFGLRTLCVTLTCFDKKDFNVGVNIVLANIKRLQESQASDRRMETTRSRAAFERLGVSNEALPKSVVIAWALLGRNIDYDVDSVISNLYSVNARDVQDAACEIFSKEPTVVLYTNKPYPSFEEIKKAINPKEEKTADKTETPSDAYNFSQAERVAMARIDALNAE